MMSRSGTERILAFLGPGAIVGELSIIDGLPRSASVVAVRELDHWLSQPRRFRGLRREASRNLQVAGDADRRALARNGCRDRCRELPAAASGRVACTLLELAEDFGQDVGSGRIVIRQKIGQSDLAAMAGIARENVSRILNDWKRRKLVSRLSGYYCLENKAKLQNEAEL